MTETIIEFHTQMELATARSACRRLLAAPLTLTVSQRATLGRVLSTLDTVWGESGSTRATLDRGEAGALVTALQRLNPRTLSGTTDSAAVALLARLPQLPLWTTANADVVAFVRLGFGDHHGLAVRSLSFTIDMPDLPTLEACLRDGIGSYARFDTAQLADALAAVWVDVSTVTLGRASSPVVEIRIPYTRQQRKGGDNAHSIPLEPGERDAVVDALVAIGQTCHADSIRYTTASQLDPVLQRPAAGDVASVRLWWD